MSMPTSAIASIAAGLIVVGRLGAARVHGDAVAGEVAEPPAAICERPALCTHRNSTLGVASSVRPSVSCRSCPSRRSRSVSGTSRGCRGRGTGSGRTPAAPISCMTMNIGADDGWMPAKLSDNVRATVTAGLAKLVDDVNQ